MTYQDLPRYSRWSYLRECGGRWTWALGYQSHVLAKGGPCGSRAEAEAARDAALEGMGDTK